MVDSSKESARKIAVNDFTVSNSDKMFALCTTQGFRVHEMRNGQLKVDCTEINGGTKLVQLYGNSSLVFFVGNGFDANYYTNKLVMWCLKEKEALAEVEFRTQIIDLLVCGDWIIVAEN